MEHSSNNNVGNRLYKLTDENLQTWNQTQWGENVTHCASGEGDLCDGGWIHAYTDPLLAVLLNPVHANFANPVLWEATGEVGKTDNGSKVGCTRLTTVKQISLPIVTLEQCIRFAILCAREVCEDEAWNEWAENWLSGRDRSKAAAGQAAKIARKIMWAVTTARWEAAVEAMEWVGDVDAAGVEAWEAEAAWEAADAAASAAAEAAENAASAATWAARAAAVKDFDLQKLAYKAIEESEVSDE